LRKINFLIQEKVLSTRSKKKKNHSDERGNRRPIGGLPQEFKRRRRDNNQVGENPEGDPILAKRLPFLQGGGKERKKSPKGREGTGHKYKDAHHLD